MNDLTAVAALTALGNKSRLKIFKLLIKTGPKGLPAGKIAETLDIPNATLSFHLKELSHSSLLDHEQQSRSIIYKVNLEVLNHLIAYLAADCCDGNPELCFTKPSVIKLVKRKQKSKA